MALHLVVHWPSLSNVYRHNPLHPCFCRLPPACNDIAAGLDPLPEGGRLQVVLPFCMVSWLAEGPSSASTSSPVSATGCAAPDAAPDAARLGILLCKLLQHHMKQCPGVPLSCCAPACAAAKVGEVHSCAAQMLCCRQVGGHSSAKLVTLDQLAGPSGLLPCSNAPAGAQHLRLQQRYMQPCMCFPMGWCWLALPATSDMTARCSQGSQAA